MADLGRAFDLAGRSDSARAYLERYVKHRFPGVMLTDPAYYAGAYRRLGELHEARGDRERALAHYEKFARIWKAADAPLQGQVADVQRRIARLRSPETR